MDTAAMLGKFKEEVGPPLTACKVCFDPDIKEFVDSLFAQGYGSSRISNWLVENNYPQMTAGVVAGHKARNHHLRPKEPVNAKRGRNAKAVSGNGSSGS